MHSTPPTRPPLRFFNALLRFFSSIKLGMALIAVIIIYSAIGSAIPPARQYFELTEFQYFNHWVFGMLIGLFCLTLTVATVRRIPFTIRNLGVLTVHAGLLTLCAGSFVYFGQKVEGDVLLLAPQIRVLSTTRAQSGQNPLIASFAAFEGKHWTETMPALGGEFDIHIVSVTHKGMETVSEAELDVKVGGGQAKRIHLSQPDAATQQLDPKSLEAHPDFARIADTVVLQLMPANVSDKFLDQQTPMLKVEGDGQPHLFRLPQLPYYQEILAAGVDPVDDENRAKVVSARNGPIPLLESWRMPISVIPPESTAAKDLGLDITIDAFLPYVEMERMPIPGGPRDAPVADLHLKVGDDETDQWLFGSIPAGSMYETRSAARLEFSWLGERTELDPEWTRKLSGKHVLDVIVKDKNINRQYEINPGQTIPIEGTDYVLTAEQLLPSWPLMTASHKDARTPTALVWVKTGSREFQRSVLQRYPELNQDRDRAGKKILETGGLVDDNLILKYADCSVPHFLVASGSNLTPTAVYTAVGGARTVRALKMGEPGRFDDGSELTIRQIIEKPKLEDRPVVVPVNRRRPLSDVRRSMSAIHVNIKSRKQGDISTDAWIPFSYYNGKLANMVGEDKPPTVVTVGDRDLQLTFGRAERPLPAPVTLERLQTEYYPGRNRPSGWQSFFRYIDPDTKDPMHTSCWLNNTAKIGDWHLFQATAASDGEAWTGLGVGNRRGVMPMLAGCILIALGLIYSFTVKPMIIRRMKRIALQTAAQMGGDLEAGPRRPRPSVLSGSTLVWMLAVATVIASCSIAFGETSEKDPAAKLRAIESQIDTQTLGAIVVQYNARFSSLEAWARDQTERVAGAGNRLLGLQPTVAAIEMMFNSGAYADEPLIYIKDRGLRLHLTSSRSKLDDDTRNRTLRQGLVSRAFLDKPEIRNILAELAGDTRLKRPMDQITAAMSTFEQFGDDFRVVPTPAIDINHPWHRFDDLMGNLPPTTRLPRSEKATPVPGVTAEQAEATLTIYRDFAKAWLDRDAAAINSNLDKLQKSLAAFSPGTYPTSTQRVWEVKYYRWRLVWWSWVSYIFAFFIAVFATATRYRWARGITLAVLGVAILLHAGDIGLRWYVIGRIPVANMYEAVVSSTFVGTVLGFVLELITAKRVFALAVAFLGFFALALPELNVLGISNSITTMMPILDDVMLRIHTVLIISSYAVITLGFAASNCYLFLAARRQRSLPAMATIAIECFLLVGAVGVYLGWIEQVMFVEVAEIAIPMVVAAFLIAGERWAAGLMLFLLGSVWTAAIVAHHAGLISQLTFILLAVISVPAMLVGAIFMPRFSPGPLLSLAAASAATPPPKQDKAGGAIGSTGMDSSRSPSGTNLFKEFDRCQCILIYIATVALFIGTTLGAVWADYSWGRPWGWDPKEVFALNTWLVYAILIHARFVTKDRALWTAVLSVVGFAAMQFNWWVVNFYIVGLHSYA